MPVNRTAVLVVNYGSSDLLAANLAGSVDGELVVVTDNWSDAREREAVLRLCRTHGWLVETPPVNEGFGAGMNIGASRAIREGATSLILLNPDARIAPSDLRKLAAQVEADKSLLLAPQIVTPDGSPWMSEVMDLRLADGTSRSSRHRSPGRSVMEWVSGAVMALSVELWERVGGFDDDYFLYWEDVDLCRRVHELGGEIRVDRTVIAVHDEGGTHADGGGRAKSEVFYYFSIRNRALYARKWLTPGQRRRWALQTPRTALDTILTGGRRQFVQSAKPWRAYVRGVIAAYRVSSRRGQNSFTSGGTRQGPGGDGLHTVAPVIRVLESFPMPSAQTNPYITQLRDSLSATAGLEVRCWSWKTALLGRYDVFHTHWTEAIIERRGRASTVGRWILFSLFLVRLWVTGTPIVRTVHNLELPRGLSVIEIQLLKVVDTLTRARIVLNSFTPALPGTTSVLIEHGHYRNWFAEYTRPPAVPGRLAFVGKVRSYKNVEGLVRAFTGLPKDEGPFSLHIAGKPSSVTLAETLRALAEADRRVDLLLGYVDDAVLAREVSEAELVVLPYHEMHNSGSVLAALSLDRPVLVPDNEFNRALACEVGNDWVITFSGALTGKGLQEAMQTVRSTSRGSRPDLSGREWSDVGDRHLAAFQGARQQARCVPTPVQASVRSE